MDDETRPVQQPQPEGQPRPATPVYAAAPAPRQRRGGLLLAGLAVAIALVAGTAGFALGNATADDVRDGPMRLFNQGPGQGDPGQGGPFGGDGEPPGGFGQGQPPTR